jgi:hypothetical protein
MASDPPTLRSIVSGFLTGAFLIALGTGGQALFTPTVQVSCPARSSAAPDCEMRWLVAFDQVTIRRTPLPGLQPGNEIVSTAPGRKGGATTMFLKTSAGPVRTIMWGDHLSLQHDLRDPLHAYFSDAHAQAIELTMESSNWVDPGGNADYRFVRKTHPLRWVVNTIIGVGLLCWVWLPVQIVKLMARRN